MKFFLFSTLMTVFTLELILQAVLYYKNHYINIENQNYQQVVIQKSVTRRISKHWANSFKDKLNYFSPPHIVYLNSDYKNEERLKKISRTSLLPISKTFKVHNFIRSLDDMPSSLMSITTNNLGMRSKKKTLQQSISKTRILALGTYTAFGHGVNDEETYLHILEQKLNEKSDSQEFEVLNFARQGTLAITGLARLKYDLYKLKPNYLILDYGWVEPYARAEVSIDQKNTKLKTSSLTWFEEVIMQARYYLPFNFLIIQRLDERFRERRMLKVFKNWQNVMKEIFKFSIENNIKVLFLKQKSVQIPSSYFYEIENPTQGIHFIDLSDSFTIYPPNKNVFENFFNDKNWLSELNIFKNDVSFETFPLDYLYLGDAIHYNKFGHAAIGKYLYDKFKNNLINNEKY